MSTLAVYLLVITGMQGNVSPSISPFYFKTKEACQSVAEDMRIKSREKANMGYAYGVCVYAEIMVKP